MNEEVVLNETHYRKTTNLGIYLKWNNIFLPKSYPSKLKENNNERQDI